MDTKILVTGSAGFIGKHLVEAIRRRPGTQVYEFDLGNQPEALEHALAEVDFIFHLAGVNRPQDPGEFAAVNAGFTGRLCERLEALNRKPVMVLSSSTQAALDNAYGISKRQAEELIEGFCRKTQSAGVIFRLPGVFGKWCRPNYNSVVATFCHQIAHDLPVTISDPNKGLELVYVDDVIASFLKVVSRPPHPGECEWLSVPRTFQVTLGDLAARIRSFRDSRKNLYLPSFDDAFNRCLYATYLSYLDGPDWAYNLEIKTDSRGSLAEFMKSPHFGQIFVSRTKPGITRGNHFHHTKTEKFLVLEGEAVIRFRHITGTEIIEYRISGSDFRVVDIPPGYTHSIENVGASDMVVLFWASEIFDPKAPDTCAMPVCG